MLLLVSHAAGSQAALPFRTVVKHPAGSCPHTVGETSPACPCFVPALVQLTLSEAVGSGGSELPGHHTLTPR